MLITILREYAAGTIAVSLLSLFMNLRASSYAVLLLYAPLLAVLNKLYLRKERSLSALLGFDSVFFFIAALLFFMLSDNIPVIERLISLPVLTAFTAYAIKDSEKEPSGYAILRVFDSTLILFLVTFSYSSFYGNADRPEIIFQLSGIMASLSALIIEKAGGVRKLRASTAAIMILSAGMVLLLSRYAYMLGDGAVYIGNLIMAIGYMFYRFFDWLFSLIPKFPPVLNSSYIPNASDNRYRSPDVLTSTISDNTLKLIIIGILSLIALTLLILVLRKVRIKQNPKERTRKPLRVSSLSFSEALSEAVRSAKAAARRQIFIMKNRNNSFGLALWLEQKLKGSEISRKESECYHDFLMRLSKISGYSELSEAAESISIALYSPEDNEPAVITDAKKIRKSVRKQVLSDYIKTHMRLKQG